MVPAICASALVIASRVGLPQAIQVTKLSLARKGTGQRHQMSSSMNSNCIVIKLSGPKGGDHVGNQNGKTGITLARQQHFGG